MTASLGPHWSVQIGEESVPIDVLLSAAFLGYSSILKKFTRGPQDLNRTNGQGMSPLIAAVLGGSADACSCLLKLGADPNFTHSNSLDSGPSQSEPAAGRHPAALHHAIFLGHRQIVELLIKSGADINQSCDHSTMHHCPWTAQKGCWWCADGAHKAGFICSMNSKVINALSIATKRGYQEVSGVLPRPDTTDTECDYLEVSKLLLQKGVHSGCLELHLAIDFGHRCLVEEILSKSDTVEHLDAPLSGITPFQAALQTRNGPVCEALLAAGFNINAKPENLLLAAEGGSAQVVRRLLRMLKTTSSSCTSESTKALQVAVKSGFPDIAEILIGEGVPLPSNWRHGVFGTYQLESLLSTLKRMQCTQDVVEHAPQDGRSVLEAAMQNPHAGVAGFALDRFPQAYDSGALLARLCTGLSANESSPDTLLDELVRRRDAAQDEDLTPALENAAIALAAYFQKTDLLSALLERPQPHAPALVPGPDLWDIRLIRGEKPCTFPNCFCYMACRNATLVRERLGGGMWWHLEDPMCSPRKTSPLFMAVKGRDPKAIHQLISKGYKPDLPTLLATIDWNEPTPTMQRLLETARKNGLGSGLWERCPQIVGYILTNGCLETLQLLTGHKEKVRNLYYDTARPYSGCFNGTKTALQLAIHAHRASDEMAYYLVGKGADVTAPAHHDSGGTALQIAAWQGKVTLARYLIGKGAQIDTPRALKLGRTCLEAAAEAGRLDMIQFLLNEGTETEGKGRAQYICAIHFARAHNHAAVEKLLRRHRHWDIPDHILDSQELLEGRDLIVFLHPDEASLEERRNVRQWCIEKEFEPPLDAELDLLSSEESELPLRERMKTLAMIMGNDREISRRMMPFVNKWRERKDVYIRGEAGYEYLVATEVEIMRRAMSTTELSTESPNSSDAGEVDDSSVPCPDEDISDVSSHAEVVQKNGSLSVHEAVGADEDNRPRIHFHPEFSKRRDSVDFHETMHEGFLI